MRRLWQWSKQEWVLLAFIVAIAVLMVWSAVTNHGAPG